MRCFGCASSSSLAVKIWRYRPSVFNHQQDIGHIRQDGAELLFTISQRLPHGFLFAQASAKDVHGRGVIRNQAVEVGFDAELATCRCLEHEGGARHGIPLLTVSRQFSNSSRLDRETKDSMSLPVNSSAAADNATRADWFACRIRHPNEIWRTKSWKSSASSNRCVACPILQRMRPSQREPALLPFTRYLIGNGQNVQFAGTSAKLSKFVRLPRGADWRLLIGLAIDQRPSTPAQMKISRKIGRGCVYSVARDALRTPPYNPPEQYLIAWVDNGTN